VAVLCLDDLSLVFLDFGSSRLHHLHIDDVVAAINTVRLVPTDEHADLLRNALSRHVADASPSQIVEVESDVFRLSLRVAHLALSAFTNDLFALSALELAESRANASFPPRIPEVLHRTSIVCTTPSSRNLDRQEDEALVCGRQVSSGRSHLSHMASPEKLCPSLRPLPAHHEKAGPPRVLGVLANRLKCTSTFPVQITRRGFECALA
jgi:hypothetical protein